MAEGLLRSMSHGRIDVQSAGTSPRAEVHPLAVSTMRDKFKIDISKHTPQDLSRLVSQHFDYVITVCARAADSCPVFPNDNERIQWHFDDPAEAQGSPEDQQRAFDRVATEIAARINSWLALRTISERLEADTIAAQ
jgi:arsenate reductase